MKKLHFTHPALEECEESGFCETIDVEGGENIVCPECQGNGVVDRSDIDCSQLVDDMREDGDEEGLEGYFRGEYDQICPECGGSNVVFRPILPEWAEKAISQWYTDQANDLAYEAQERTCGA